MVNRSKKTPALTDFFVGNFLGLILFLLLIIFAVLCNILQVLIFPVYLISKKKTRLINEFLLKIWWGLVVFFLRNTYQTSLHFTGDEIPNKESALVIANHQSMVDIPSILAFAYEKKSLGTLKWFVKDALKFIPCLGWGMKMAGFPFLKRKWIKDKGLVNKVLNKLCKEKLPFWLVSFPEGTRLSVKKLLKSQDFCQRKGKPVLKNIVSPRVRGFISSRQFLKTSIDAVYDITIGFPEGRPSLYKLFTGRVKSIHLHIRRFSEEDLPYASDDLNKWIWSIYEEKDYLLDELNKLGKFPQHISSI